MIETTLTEFAITVLIGTFLILMLITGSQMLSQKIHRIRMRKASITCRACSHVWKNPRREKLPECPQCGRANRRRDDRLN